MHTFIMSKKQHITVWIRSQAGRDMCLSAVIMVWLSLGGLCAAYTPNLFGSDVPAEICNARITVFTTFSADQKCF